MTCPAHLSNLSPPSPTCRRTRSLLLSLLSAVLLSPHRAQASCECGYRVTVNSSSVNTTEVGTTDIPQQYVLTDLIETNFANISDISKNSDWQRQAWNTTAAESRGTYGEMMAVDNVISSEGEGLQIIVRAGDITDNMVQGGEIDSLRRDLLYGTFRSSVKLTDASGTVSAFFWVSASPAFERRRFKGRMGGGCEGDAYKRSPESSGPLETRSPLGRLSTRTSPVGPSDQRYLTLTPRHQLGTLVDTDEPC